MENTGNTYQISCPHSPNELNRIKALHQLLLKIFVEEKGHELRSSDYMLSATLKNTATGNFTLMKHIFITLENFLED